MGDVAHIKTHKGAEYNRRQDAIRTWVCDAGRAIQGIGNNRVLRGPVRHRAAAGGTPPTTVQSYFLRPAFWCSFAGFPGTDAPFTGLEYEADILLIFPFDDFSCLAICWILPVEPGAVIGG